MLRIDATGQKRECPAPIDDALATQIRELAYLVYRVAGCRDYARIDLRLGDDGKLYAVAIHTQDIFARKGSLASMIKAAGLNWSGLLRHIIELAAARTGAELATKLAPAGQETPQVANPAAANTTNIVASAVRAR